MRRSHNRVGAESEGTLTPLVSQHEQKIQAVGLVGAGERTGAERSGCEEATAVYARHDGKSSRRTGSCSCSLRSRIRRRSLLAGSIGSFPSDCPRARLGRDGKRASRMKSGPMVRAGPCMPDRRNPERVQDAVGAVRTSSSPRDRVFPP